MGDPEKLLEELPDAPALFHTYRSLLATGHTRAKGGWIFDGEFYPDYLTVGGNSRAIQRTALRFCQGHGLDVGASYWPLPGSMPIDNELGPGLENAIEDVAPGSQDYVFSSHCLEHIPDWEAALDEWISKIRPGGVLFLYLPHPACKLWQKSNPQMANIHAWIPTFDVVAGALAARGLTVIEKDEGPDHFFSFFVCARKP
jgi:SAM-dependent methyltransferase